MNRHILIIDDDPNLLNLYRDYLTTESQMGSADTPKSFEVTTAGHGQAGYEIVKQQLAQNQPFAVAFIDMRMRPGWDGLRAAREIRALDDWIFIVIITGYRDHSIAQIQDILEHDVFYLSKPSCKEEIYQMAHSLCTRWNRDFRSDLAGTPKDSSQKTASCEEHLSGIVTISGITEKTRALLNNTDFVIRNFPFKIGRSVAANQENLLSDNGLLIQDSEPYIVSKHHLLINHYNGEYYVLDTGSHLGTVVNDEQIGRKISRYKSVLHTGENCLIVGGESSPFAFYITISHAPVTEPTEKLQ
ncbi:MAG: response regulator [Fidelibacterota bacterium]